MSTVNFSVPDDVKEAFNATFAGQNKSAVIADLMREAVQRAGGNLAAAARTLGLTRPQLSYRLSRLQERPLAAS